MLNDLIDNVAQLTIISPKSLFIRSGDAKSEFCDGFVQSIRMINLELIGYPEKQIQGAVPHDGGNHPTMTTRI